MEIFLITTSIIIIPYVLYRKFLINIMRSYEIQLENFLKKKKINIQNFAFDLNTVFTFFKFVCLFSAFKFFLFATHMFYRSMSPLAGLKLFLGVVLFGSIYFTLSFLLYKICINAFKRKFIHIDEIIDIYLACYAIVFLCVCVDEFVFYPGKQIIKEFAHEQMETVEVDVNSKNLNKNTDIPPTIHSPTPDEDSNQGPSSIVGEVKKYAHNVIVRCGEIVETVGEPDSSENIEKSLQKNFPPATVSPTSDTIDEELQAKAKVCSIITGIAKSAAEFGGYEFSQESQKYQSAPFTDDDYSPKSSPGGTPRDCFSDKTN